MARFLSPVLSAQFMTPIPTLILNLASSWSLSWTSSCPSPSPGSSLRPLTVTCWSLPAFGYALFILFHVLIPAVGYALSFLLHVIIHQLQVRSCHLPEVLVGAAVDSSLFSSVRTCVRSPASPLASAGLTLPVQCEALLRQGLGFPRADPRVHLRTFSHVLRVVWESPAPTLRKTPPPPGTVRGGQ